MKPYLTTALLLAASSVSPPGSESPPVEPEAPEPGPFLLDVGHESSPIDTSKPDSIPEPGWRARQRQTATREQPVVQQQTWTSRKLRRDSGDRRTVKQIMAEQRREGR